MAILNFKEEPGNQPEPVNSPQSVALTPPLKSDPPPGRKMSREEAMEYVFKKNEELYRRLA